MMPPMNQEEITEAAYGQRFAIQRSIRYHGHRIAFWEFLAFITKLLEFIPTSTAFIFIFSGNGGQHALQWVLLAAAIFSFLAIILEAHRRIKHQSRQRARMCELDLRLPLNLETVTEGLLEDIYASRRRIELDDGVLLPCLNVICHNEQLTADGHPENPAKLNFVERNIGRYLPIPYSSKP